VARILHLLPHRGGGGQRYVETLTDGLPEHEHETGFIAGSPSPVRSGLGLVFRRPFVAARARTVDLVHLHGDMTAMLSKQLVGARPTVVTTHGLHFVRRAKPPLLEPARRALRGSAERASAVLCTSDAELEEMAELTAGAARLVRARNGVPIPPPTTAADRRAAREALGLHTEEPVALFVGELSERKGVLLAARAATTADFTLLVAGEGSQRRELDALTTDRLRALGHRDDVPRLLQAADVFVLPSTREGLSLALLEAMAAGLAPVVASGSGNPEAVGDAGLVVDGEEALAAELGRLKRNPDEIRRRGMAARARVEVEFSEAGMLETVRDAYEAALGRLATA
jgi:glycosyltransferase involved in cell wall biosynthesis